jgi:hypothetical protein
MKKLNLNWDETKDLQLEPEDYVFVPYIQPTFPPIQLPPSMQDALVAAHNSGSLEEEIHKGLQTLRIHKKEALRKLTQNYL